MPHDPIPSRHIIKSITARKLAEQLSSEPEPFHKTVTRPIAKFTKQVGETLKNGG